MTNPTLNDVAKKGFVFGESKGWLTDAKLAQDAALTTSPNTTVPAFLLQYVSPDVIEILTAKRAATRVFDEKKVGDWTTANYQYAAIENVGSTYAYADYGDGPSAGINSEWNIRDQYVFQTNITYGDREVDMSATAKIDLIASKQRAAAEAIAIDSNKFYLQGVAGKRIYGLLNDPNLPSAIAPNTVGSAVTWASKLALASGGTAAIYGDILKLFSSLQGQMGGLIDENTRMKLLVSPGCAVNLMSATDFNVSVMDMLKKAMPSLEIETVPECATASGNIAMLIVPEVLGQQTGELAFGEKIRQGRLIADLSSYRQKFAASTYGFIMRMPAAFAVMSGI